MLPCETWTARDACCSARSWPVPLCGVTAARRAAPACAVWEPQSRGGAVSGALQSMGDGGWQIGYHAMYECVPLQHREEHTPQHLDAIGYAWMRFGGCPQPEPCGTQSGRACRRTLLIALGPQPHASPAVRWGLSSAIVKFDHFELQVLQAVLGPVLSRRGQDHAKCAAHQVGLGHSPAAQRVPRLKTKACSSGRPGTDRQVMWRCGRVLAWGAALGHACCS